MSWDVDLDVASLLFHGELAPWLVWINMKTLQWLGLLLRLEPVALTTGDGANDLIHSHSTDWP